MFGCTLKEVNAFRFQKLLKMAATDVPFTKQMRIATREIHNISDNLINAKLGIGKYDWERWFVHV